MSDEGRLDYKYPRNLTLTIAVLYLSNYFQTTDQGVIARARDLLGEHNIKLDVVHQEAGCHCCNRPFGSLWTHDLCRQRKGCPRVLR